MTSFTRGPLPARVYWTRRLALLAVALLLVVGIAKALALGGDGSSADARATQVSAEATSSAPAGEGSTAASPSVPGASASASAPAAAGGTRHAGKARGAKAPVLAPPEGTCADEDVTVTPEAVKAVAGPLGEVKIALHLTTTKSAACTWRVSPDTLTLKITSGSDDIWSSRQCPRVVPVTDVVVRNNVTTTVDVAWNGRRADRGCGKLSAWALPGTYHVAAAALAGEPTDEQFDLLAPQAPVITLAPSPTQTPSKGKRASSSGSAPDASPSSSH